VVTPSEADWGWAGPMIDTRRLFPVDRHELLDLLGSLDDADWQCPTVCPGWSVHDVTGHLLHDYLRRLSGTRDRHPGIWLPAEDLPSTLAQVNEAFVAQTRGLSPRVLTDLLAHLGPQLDAVWASMDLAALGRNDVWWAAPDVPAPVWLDVAREYTEFWVHQQQIRDATGRPGADRPELMRPVIDTFLRALPHTLREVAAGPGTALRIRVEGPAGGTWTVTRAENGWSMAGEPDPGRITLLEIGAGTVWRLATGGRTPESALADVRLTGDEALRQAALRIVAIIR
jgi:uncharacterized protein (TIGR03083 family)